MPIKTPRSTFFIVLFCGALGCAKNPVTNRSQLKLVDDGEVAQLAAGQYKTFLSAQKVIPSSNANAAMVTRVGQRIANAVEQYYKEKGISGELANFKWEYNLVESKEVNAWCMPGGKIVVYTGLLPISKDEAGLAVVMGHEIAHALAKHGAERMSQSMLQQYGNLALSVAMVNKPAETQALFGAAYGLGSQYGLMMPFSRKHELEADKFGLMFSAKAGYDPRAAIPLWQRMASASSGQKPPEWMSTHPAEETRIKQLQDFMPTALTYFEKK